MADTPIHSHPGQVRLSDEDRDRAAERLRNAVAEGRLTVGELDDRLTEVFAAKVTGDLAPVLRDLPVVAPPAHPDGTPMLGGAPGSRRRSVALLGTVRRGERWVVPSRYTAVATLGTVELDLRDAVFAAPETVIKAYGALGWVRVTVPPGVEVRVEGRAVVGEFGRSQADTGTLPGTPGQPVTGIVVRVEGAAVLGGVAVQVRAPRSPSPQRRFRLRWWIRIR